MASARELLTPPDKAVEKGIERATLLVARLKVISRLMSESDPNPTYLSTLHLDVRQRGEFLLFPNEPIEKTLVHGESWYDGDDYFHSGVSNQMTTSTVKISEVRLLRPTESGGIILNGEVPYDPQLANVTVKFNPDEHQLAWMGQK